MRPFDNKKKYILQQELHMRPYFSFRKLLHFCKFPSLFKEFPMIMEKKYNNHRKNCLKSYKLLPTQLAIEFNSYFDNLNFTDNNW